ncbi:MAG: ATP synthase subunit c [candidate division TM6 bacterium GW2011_GWF2_32_72]|nr:MAG: ATP synthase subunit c [candidate division TM6 bacterium GW2011_GWF2_32_72]
MDDLMYYAKAARYIAAGLCMAIGTVGPALGQGFIGSETVKSIGKYPESASKIQGAMLVSMGIIESSAVYALLIAVLLLFVSI